MTDRTSPPPARTAPKPWTMQGWEPAIEEMLADPVVQAVMSVDRVHPAEVVSLLRDVRARLDAAAASP